MAAVSEAGSTRGNGHFKAHILNGGGGGATASAPGTSKGLETCECSDLTFSEPVSSASTPPAMNVTSSKRTGTETSTAASKGGKRPLDPSEVNNLFQKISQLETESSLEEGEEKAISRAVRKANKELTELVSSREDHIAKVEAVQTKYSELLYEMKRVERDHAKSRKRAEQLQKEKDQSRSEMQKAVSMKHKLETLCRELQKENKRIKDESKKLAQNEQQKREELSEKFESTIWEIKSRMEEEDEGGSSRKSSVGADELFKAKFKSFIDQYEMRELHFQSLLRTKELEVQWNLARYEQQRKQAESEAQRAKALHAQVSTFSQTEAELRSQLNIYVEKFKQVEDTLNNSNDLFLTFRKEMEEMSKKTKRLEKENHTLTRKSDTTNRNLLEMAEERTRHQRDLETLRKKNIKLESICRALQKERNALENRLRAEGGEDILEDDVDSEDYDESDELEEGSDGASDEVEEDTEDDNLVSAPAPQMNGKQPSPPLNGSLPR